MYLLGGDVWVGEFAGPMWILPAVWARSLIFHQWTDDGKWLSLYGEFEEGEGGGGCHIPSHSEKATQLGRPGHISRKEEVM